MRRYTALAVILATLALASCAIRPPSTTAPETVTVPDVIGEPGDEARDALEDLGLEVEWDAGDETVIMAGNWTVDAQSPVGGVEAAAGSTVTLTVSKPDPAPATALTTAYAMIACDRRGEIEFPYGYDPHWVLGLIAEEQRADDVLWLKVEVTVTNGFNAERDVVVECEATGVDGGTVTVTEFLAYG